MGYRVRQGGSPPDSGVVLFERSDAEQCAISQARRRALACDDDAGTVDLYGGPGDPNGWGACPSGDDGAYYPVITVEP
jgi:hypothetical protein